MTRLSEERYRASAVIVILPVVRRERFSDEPPRPVPLMTTPPAEIIDLASRIKKSGDV